MSQRDTLRAMDAALDQAFKAAGLADSAFYIAPGQPVATAVPCDPLVDRDVEIYGDEGAEVAARVTTVTLRRAQVDARRGALLVLGSDPSDPAAERFRLAAPVGSDESRTIWQVIDDK